MPRILTNEAELNRMISDAIPHEPGSVGAAWLTIRRIEDGSEPNWDAEFSANSPVMNEAVGSAVSKLRARYNLKGQKTAKELADLVNSMINVGGVMIAVHPDAILGWHPTVMTHPANAINCQLLAEQAAQELRAIYELKA